MLEELTKIFTDVETPLGVWEAIIPIGFSLLAAIVAYFMYQFFYGSRHIGAGVHRTFLIGGPAITTLFLGIQTSIPLSLGLLGALSFVRFRTPVKDPAEIGFLLLLIASSIGAATKNYLLTALLFVVVFIALGISWLVRNRVSIFSRGNLIIAIDQQSYEGTEQKLGSFLKEKLHGLRLDTVSVVDGRLSLHYQYQQRPGIDSMALINEIKQITGPSNTEVFIG
jgi:hypothetical protein